MASPINSTVSPSLRYADGDAALEWMTKVCGMTLINCLRDDNGRVHHAEISYGNGVVMIGEANEQKPIGPRSADPIHSIYLVVEDVDTHYKRATEAGIIVVRPLADTDYGSREYSAKDPEGNPWSFGTYQPGIPWS